ncbi:MAG: 3-dehydroquinate synthase, partial [Chitinivibrionales bacterium]
MIISLRLGRDSYDVMLDEEAELTEIIEERFSDRGVVIVTNPTLRSLYAERFETWKAGFNPLVIEIPDGEEYKNLDTWRGILDEMLHAGFDRRCVVVTFGGGVVGDVGGFAASSFLRGVDYIQIPTTLLAMVDSSVGGKTGVNHARGKNLIGSFYQPKLVYADISFLDTLPEREFLSGYGEVFKYGFIGGRDTFDFICSNHDSIVKKRDRGVLQEAVERSIRIKADIVSMDEREKGVRALLNFGHTFGHSLEKYFKYKGILHGEGVL